MELQLKNGGRTIMVRYQKIIQAFITKNKLTPAVFQQERTAKAPMMEVYPIWLKYGGMVGPHFHLGEKTFILTDEQWGKFSKELIVDFKGKLEAAKSITFEDALNIDAAISAIS